MPADTNPYGGVFGGWLMSQMALAAGRSPRASQRQMRGGRGGRLSFTGALKVGDEIAVYADLDQAGPQSMTHRRRRAVARERDGETAIRRGDGRIHLRRAG